MFSCFIFHGFLLPISPVSYSYPHSWIFTQTLTGKVKVMNQAVRPVDGSSSDKYQLRVLAFE